MLDYKTIINKHYGLGMSGAAIAYDSGASKSGVNDFLRAFERCEKLSYPLPEGIKNYAIYEMVYGKTPGTNGRDLSFELPEFAEISRAMTKKNMTLVFQWDKYAKKCRQNGHKYYQYRQFCERYSRWCEENQETLHFDAVIGQTVEVDFAGQTFWMIDSLTGEAIQIVVFVAVLPYSQYIEDLAELGLMEMSTALESLYRSPRFLEMDHLTMLAALIEPEYTTMISKRLNNRLKNLSFPIFCTKNP